MFARRAGRWQDLDRAAEPLLVHVLRNNLPNIETIIVEAPLPAVSLGARGAGKPILPALAAIANALLHRPAFA